jgi:hypothetical protein
LTLFPPPSLNPSDLKFLSLPSRFLGVGPSLVEHYGNTYGNQNVFLPTKNSNTSNNMYANGTKRSLGTFFEERKLLEQKLENLQEQFIQAGYTIT